MYVPAFPGLAPADLGRSRVNRPARFPFNAPRALAFYRARNAIYHLFRALRGTAAPLTVIAPDYYSGNEVLAIRAAGATLQFARVDGGMRLDPGEVEHLCGEHHPDVLFVIHYLGWPQPIRELAALCRRRGIVLVEDCALSLLSDADGQPLGSFGDYAIFCLYKTVPVPNGALLVGNGPDPQPLADVTWRSASAISVLGRVAELFAVRARSRADRLGMMLHAAKRSAGRAATALGIHRAPLGDIGFDVADADLAMSSISHRLVERVDLEHVKRQRVENFRRLDETIDGHARRVYPNLADGLCPLSFPILVSDKHAAAEALRSRGIEAIEMWNDEVMPERSEMSPDVRFLREHVLELPVHQDLTADHIAHIAREVVALNLRSA